MRVPLSEDRHSACREVEGRAGRNEQHLLAAHLEAERERELEEKRRKKEEKERLEAEAAAAAAAAAEAEREAREREFIESLKKNVPEFHFLYTSASDLVGDREKVSKLLLEYKDMAMTINRLIEALSKRPK